MKKAFFAAALLSAGLLLNAGITTDGLIAEWNCNAGNGSILHDSAGKSDGQIKGSFKWIKTNAGYCLYFNGISGYVDFGRKPALDLRGPLSLEVWANPTGPAKGEEGIAGMSNGGFFNLDYYHGGAWGYIHPGGGNNLSTTLLTGSWTQLVLTFDGTQMSLYANGILSNAKKSLPPKFPVACTTFRLACLCNADGAPGPGSAFFDGMLDDIRLYNRALTPEEVAANFNAGAADKGLELLRSGKSGEIFADFFQYPARNGVAALIDYSWITPLPEGAGTTLEVVDSTGKIVKTTTGTAADLRHESNLELPVGELPPGRYTLRAGFKAGEKVLSVQETELMLPLAPPTAVPPPARETAGTPEPWFAPCRDFTFAAATPGKLQLTIGDRAFRIGSIHTLPGGRYLDWSKGRVAAVDDAATTVTVDSDIYTLTRTVRREEHRIIVTDRYQNRTDRPQGIQFANYIALEEGLNAEIQPNPSIWVYAADKDIGVGLIALDDIYQCQSVSRRTDSRAELADDHFALPPRGTHVLEWAIYPASSKDAMNFINLVRRDYLPPLPLPGGFIFGRTVPDAETIRRWNAAFFSYPCLTDAADDGFLDIEGYEFVEYPKERARLRKLFAEVRARFPGMHTMFHVAHTLFATTRPERFADSIARNADGSHVTYNSAWDYYQRYFPKEWYDAGGRWYIYYPTTENSFGKFGLRGTDMMLDPNEIGVDSMWADDFVTGYVRDKYMPDAAWDNASALIDPKTHEIERLVTHITLIQLPFMIAVADKVEAAGGYVLTNGIAAPRSLWGKKIIASNETSGSDQQSIGSDYFSRAFAPLGNGQFIKNSTDIYRDIYHKLQFGAGYFSYGGTLDYDTILIDLYPVTQEAIRRGVIMGPERIVASRNGVYGWEEEPLRSALPRVRFYDARGRLNEFRDYATVDASGVRTALRFGKYESAVIIPLPLTIHADKPVNFKLLKYDETGLTLALDGNGRVTLKCSDSARLPFRTEQFGNGELSMEIAGPCRWEIR